MLCPAPRLCQFSNSPYPFHSPSPPPSYLRLAYDSGEDGRGRREREREGFFCERGGRDCRFASSYTIFVGFHSIDSKLKGSTKFVSIRSIRSTLRDWIAAFHSSMRNTEEFFRGFILYKKGENMKLVKAASSLTLRGKRTNDETGTERISTVNRFFSQNGTRPATTVDTTSND